MHKFIKIIAIACLFIFIYSTLIFGAEIDDPAIQFYLNKADSVLNSSPLFNKELKYSVSLFSIYNKINYRGITSGSDTANYLIDFIDGRFIVSETIDSAGTEENIVPVDIQLDKPWEYNCRFYFFPRDTGAGDLAIGFAPADSLEKRAPEGMIIIDRDSYQIKHVYLHYLNIDDYEWLSKDYQFSYENKMMLLKSLILQGCYYGFFQRRFFRHDLIFNNYTFQ